MAKVADQVIESLKREIPLQDAFLRYQKVTQSSGWWAARCMSGTHEDKGPSLKWKDGDTQAHCFACGWLADIFEIVKKGDQCDFHEAYLTLKGMREGERSFKEGRGGIEKAFKEPVKSQERTIDLSVWLKVFHAPLSGSQEALGYLGGRGLSRETIAKFALGFSVSGSQICSPEDPHHSCPWVGVPYVEGDKVVGVKWRDVRHKEYRAARGMSARIFNAQDPVDEFGDLFVTAGEFDCILLEQAGFRAVSLHSDSKPPTLSERELLIKAGRLVYAGDSDASGQRAMNKLGMELKCGQVLSWPEGIKDANEMYLKNPSAFPSLVEDLCSRLSDPMPPGFVSLSAQIDDLKKGSVELDPERFRWPWEEVDDMFIILPGHVITVSSTFTGTGKSTFVFQGQLYNATAGRDAAGNPLTKKQPAVYAAEQSPDELARMAVAYLSLQSEADCSVSKNNITDEMIRHAKQKLEGSRFFIGYDPSKNNVKEVMDLCEGAARHLGITDLVIDNMGFIARNAGPRLWDSQADAMQRIKNLAKEISVRIWVICAARKASSENRRSEMEMSDIHGSQAFEADADHVITLHRPLLRNPPVGARDLMSRVTFINRKKSRSPGPGPARTRLLLLGHQARFTRVHPELLNAEERELEDSSVKREVQEPTRSY